jgi:hypothetical protein
MTQIRSAIPGAGSVGLGLAASLALAGQKVTLLTRSASVAALRDATITVDGRHGAFALAPGAIAVADAALPPDAARGCDMLIIRTKTQDIATALCGVCDRSTAAGSKPRSLGSKGDLLQKLTKAAGPDGAVPGCVPDWRRRWDSNPRGAFTSNGFQDRRNRPLCHSSGPSVVVALDYGPGGGAARPITLWGKPPNRAGQDFQMRSCPSIVPQIAGGPRGGP